MLEGVARQVATFHQLALRHWGFAANWISFTDSSETTETARAELQKRLVELNDGYSELTSAETTLLLLGEEKCRQVLRDYALTVVLFKTDRIVARITTKERLDDYKGDLEKILGASLLNSIEHIRTSRTSVHDISNCSWYLREIVKVVQESHLIH